MEVKVRNWDMARKFYDNYEGMGTPGECRGTLTVMSSYSKKVILRNDEGVLVVTDASNIYEPVIVKMEVNGEVNEVDLEDIVRAVWNSYLWENKILAIKMVRMITGWDLKNSKDWVENTLRDVQEIAVRNHEIRRGGGQG